MAARRLHLPGPARHLLAILAGATILLWPALFNRFPLIGNDTFGYVVNGQRAMRLLLGRGNPIQLNWMRAELYSLGLYVLQHPHSPWPPVLFDALLTAWILWLLIRSLGLRNTVAAYLSIVTILGLTTALGWWVSFLSPDVLGPVLYLSLYLLVFARESFSRSETFGVAAIAWWAITAHATHLAVAIVLLAGFAVLWLVRWPGMAGRGRGVLQATSVLLLAIAAQMAVHARLFGKPSIHGVQAPFLMARALGDGPARLYLRNNCDHLDWLICTHVDHLPTDEAEFLWATDGIWANADTAQRSELRREEMPLVLATLRSYPIAQAQASLHNVWHELAAFGIWFPFQADTFLVGLDEIMPGFRVAYQRSRQSANGLPQRLFTWIQWLAVGVSLLLAPFLIVGACLRREASLLAFTFTICIALVSNGAVCGILSGFDQRYNCRVIALLPLLVLVLAARRWYAAPVPGPARSRCLP